MVPQILQVLGDTLRGHNVPVGKVLEVGSRDVNGTPRSIFQQHAETYLGIDLEAGAGCDQVLNAERLTEFFPYRHFDTVICTETLEHCVRPWLVVEEMKKVLKTGGHLWVSTPTFGFPLHRYPIDCYRFGEDAYRLWLFDGMELLMLQEIKSEHDNPILVAVGRK